MKKIIFLTITIIFLFSPILSIKAEENGCCELEQLNESGTSTFFFDSTKVDCEDYNDLSDYSAIFHANQIASSDQKSCINKKEKQELGSSLPKINNPLNNPKLSVKIPSLSELRSIKCETTDEGEICYIPWLADYIDGLYRYGIGALVILAVVTMMIGGIIWLTAAGNEQRISDAKNWINGSLFGVLIALSSYMILVIVNPALVELSPIKLTTISEEDLKPMQEPLTNDVIPGTIQSKGQACFLETFGSSAKEVEKNLVTVNILGLKRSVHKLAKDAFEKVDKELAGKLGNYVVRSGDTGTYIWRANVNNPSKLSLHSFGIAIDVNWNTNPNYRSTKKPCEGDHPAALINAFKAAGFRWGGDYRRVCDSMHFEWLGPCQK